MSKTLKTAWVVYRGQEQDTVYLSRKGWTKTLEDATRYTSKAGAKRACKRVGGAWASPLVWVEMLSNK